MVLVCVKPSDEKTIARGLLQVFRFCDVKHHIVVLSEELFDDSYQCRFELRIARGWLIELVPYVKSIGTTRYESVICFDTYLIVHIEVRMEVESMREIRIDSDLVGSLFVDVFQI